MESEITDGGAAGIEAAAFEPKTTSRQGDAPVMITSRGPPTVRW
jgi:hypothetical protein